MTISRVRPPSRQTSLIPVCGQILETSHRNGQLHSGQAATAAAEAAGPFSERPPTAAASSSNHGKAARSGPTENGTLVLGSKKAAAGRLATVDGVGLVPSAAPVPRSVDGSTAVVAGEAAKGTRPSCDQRRRPEAGDGLRVANVPQEEEEVPPCAAGRQAEGGNPDRLATVQTVQGTAVVADGASHRAGIALPLGYEAGRAEEGGVGAAAAPVAGVAPVSCPTRGCARVAAPLNRTVGKAPYPDNGSEGEAAVLAASAPVVADVGDGAAAAASQHVEEAADRNGGDSRGEDIFRSSREGGVFSGDPEVTVSAAPSV